MTALYGGVHVVIFISREMSNKFRMPLVKKRILDSFGQCLGHASSKIFCADINVEYFQDLFIWKHQVKCAAGHMFIYHRYRDVTKT